MNELMTIPKVVFKNKATIVLTVFQVALTLAILVNTYASFDGFKKMIGDNMGMDQERIVTAEITSINLPDASGSEDVLDFYRDHATQNFNIISEIPGVESVSNIDSFPMSDDAKVEKVSLARDSETSMPITVYTGDEKVIGTLGLEVVAGSNFLSSDAQWVIDSEIANRQPLAIISSALAKNLFGEENPLGKTIYISNQQLTVAAVTNVLPGLHPLWANSKYSAIVPGRLAFEKRRFMIKVSSNAQVNHVLSQVENDLTGGAHANRFIVFISTIKDIKEETLNSASSTLKILGFVSILLLVVTAFGTYGQTSFLVSKRGKETGIKRAIGATKSDVLIYYLAENSLVTVIGIFFGLALAYMLNFLLVSGLGATKINTEIVIPSILFIWVVGILSAILPAWQATRIPPALATRST